MSAVSGAFFSRKSGGSRQIPILRGVAGSCAVVQPSHMQELNQFLGPRSSTNAMAQTLPKEVDILNLTYKINWITPPEEAAPEQLGLCDFQAQVISVTKSLPRQSRAETLLHEIIHAINHGMGAPNKIDEEKFTSKMSIGIATSIKQSPEVWRWISKEICSKTSKPS